MAGEWGGKRTPSNPAPVSGPGQLSQRTDGGPQQVQADMTGMPYGENAEFNTMQSMAPMSASPSARSPRSSARKASQAGGMSATPLFSPTQRPDEPVTAGAPFGPGDNPMGQPSYSQISNKDLENIKQYLPDLIEATNFQDAPETFKALVSYLRNS
jgi:predicted lipid-binding transport protein (Tim44 family)